MIRAQRRMYHTLAIQEMTGLNLNSAEDVDEAISLASRGNGDGTDAERAQRARLFKMIEKARERVDGNMLNAIELLGNQVAIARLVAEEQEQVCEVA